MLQTVGGNPKYFNKLDLKRLPSPCFVIDKIALQSNLEILYELKKRNKRKNSNCSESFFNFFTCRLNIKILRWFMLFRFV